MSKKLLDTTFLIHYWGGRERAESYLEANEASSDFLTTTLNLQEIAIGLEFSGDLDPVTVGTVFDWVEFVPFEPKHAYEAARLETTIRRDDSINGDKLNELTADVLIAAVGKHRNATIVTENVEDFELIDGVDVESY